MFTLGIPLKQKRRTLGYLSNEYFPGGMKKLGQQVPYEIISTDRKGGFFVISFPNMDEYEFRNITFQLKQQGVTVIGADSQLTEKTMKLKDLVPLKENRLSPPGGFTGKLVKQLVQADKDTMFFANGKYYVAENPFQDFIEDFQVMDRDGYGDYIDFKDIEFAEGGAVRPQFIPGLNESLQVTTNDGKIAIISDPEDIKTFYRGGTVFGDDSDGDSIELSKETSLDFQSLGFRHYEEGSCGYAPEGEDPNEADQPAGSHLLRKKIREIIQEKMKHPQYRDASNQYAQRGKPTRLSPEKKAAQKDRMKALAQRIKDLDKEKDIDESYVDDPNVPGVTGMEDAVNDPNAKAEKILMSLAKSFGNIPLEKVVNDSTYKRQAITSILFGMMNEDAS